MLCVEFWRIKRIQTFSYDYDASHPSSKDSRYHQHSQRQGQHSLPLQNHPRRSVDYDFSSDKKKLCTPPRWGSIFTLIHFIYIEMRRYTVNIWWNAAAQEYIFYKIMLFFNISSYICSGLFAEQCLSDLIISCLNLIFPFSGMTHINLDSKFSLKSFKIFHSDNNNNNKKKHRKT